MMNIAPQLAFAGQCRQAFEFYAKLLIGEITAMNTFGGNEDRKLPPGSVATADDQIRFAEVRFGTVRLGAMMSRPTPAHRCAASTSHYIRTASMMHAAFSTD